METPTEEDKMTPTQLEWLLKHVPQCREHACLMEPISRGIFDCEKEGCETIVYEVFFRCYEKNCKDADLLEWYIKPKNIKKWDERIFEKKFR